MSVLTYNVKHNTDISSELDKALRIAKFGLIHKCSSSKQVSHFGLKSALSNAVLRKYTHCKTIKEVKNIVIPINNQSFRYDGSEVYIVPLKMHIPFVKDNITNIKYIELDKEYAHIACEVSDKPTIHTTTFLGIDRNTTGHIAVCSNPDTHKVLKLGKECQHIHKKYSSLRRTAQKDGAKKNHHKYRKVKKLKHRESNIVKSLNHQISRKIVDIAVKDNATIVLEDLKSIRNTPKSNRRFRYSLNSWSFYQLQTQIGYKAKLQGIPVMYVSPAYTSQLCSKCGSLGNRNGKVFKCPVCGHADHADVNAGFNIALRGRLMSDSDGIKGTTDSPNGAMV